jgi:hypothetical protein
MKNKVKQLLESVLKESFEAGISEQVQNEKLILLLNGNKEVFENKEALINALKGWEVDAFVEIEDDIAAEEFNRKNGLVPLNDFINKAIETEDIYKIFNETMCDRGDDYCEFQILTS